MENPSFYHTKNYNPDAEKIDFVIWGQYTGNKNGYPTITQIDTGKFSHKNPQSSEPETLEIKNISLFSKRKLLEPKLLEPKDINKGKYEEVQIGEEFNKCIELLLKSNQQQETKHREENDFDLKNSSGNFLLWGHIEGGFMRNVSGKFSMNDRQDTLSILNAKITDHPNDNNKSQDKKRKIVDMGSPSDDEILGEDQLNCLEPKAEDKEIVQEVNEKQHSKIKKVIIDTDNKDSQTQDVNVPPFDDEVDENNVTFLRTSAWMDESNHSDDKFSQDPSTEDENSDIVYNLGGLFKQPSIESDTSIEFGEFFNKDNVIVGSNIISEHGENPYFEEYLKSYQQFFEQNKSYFHKKNIDITNPIFYKKDVYNQFTFKDVLKEHETKIRDNKMLTNIIENETTYEKCLVCYYKQIKEIKGNFAKENKYEEYVIIVFYLQDEKVHYLITDEDKIDLNRNTNLPRITEKLVLDNDIGDGFKNSVFTIGKVEKDDEKFVEQQHDNFIKHNPGDLGNTIIIEPYLIIDNDLEFSFDYLYVKTGKKNNKKDFFIKNDNINMIPNHRVVTVNGESVTKVVADTNNFIKIGNDERHRLFGGAKKRRSKRKKSKSKNTTLRR